MAPAAKSPKRKQVTDNDAERPSKKAHKQKKVEEAVEEEEEQQYEDTEMAEEYEEEQEVGDEETEEDGKPKQSKLKTLLHAFVQSWLLSIMYRLPRST
jgi:hypothetical protein